MWFRSSVKRVNDALSRNDRIEKARADLQELAGSLSGPRCQLKSRQAVEDAAHKVVASHVAGRWVRFEVADDVVTESRRERRGRPGKDTRYKKIEAHRLYENRARKTPRAARVLEVLAPLARTVVCHRDEVLTVAPPELSPLQEQLLTLLTLLEVPPGAYVASCARR